MKKSVIFLIIGVFLMTAGVAAGGQKVTCGTSADWPPFEWVDSNGNIVGFDMDVMRMIAHLSGWELEIKDLAYDSLIPALKNGKIDVIAAEVNITPERAARADFSDPYWTTDQAILIAKDSEITMATLFSNDSKIGAQIGTTQAKYLEDAVNSGVKITFKPYETNDLAIMDLQSGRIDAFMGDTTAARVFADTWSLDLIGIIIQENSEVGFAVQKGDAKKLLPPINAGLKQLRETGVWPVLTEAYVAGDLTKITECYQAARKKLEKLELLNYATELKGCLVKR